MNRRKESKKSVTNNDKWARRLQGLVDGISCWSPIDFKGEG